MKEPSYFIDTNIFLRIIAKDDQEKTSECEKIIQAIQTKKIRACTSSLVLAEMLWVGMKIYGIEKTEITKIIRGIVSVKNLKIQDKTNPLTAIDTYANNKIKFIDALIASHPQIAQKNMKIISYDKDFDTIGIERVEPREILKGIAA